MTALSRRKFFAAGAGAAVAAPKIAGDLRGRSIGVPAAAGVGYGQSESAGVDIDWALGRRAELEKLARGDFSGELEYDLHPAGDPRIDNIEALRSVSTSTKRLLANDLARRRGRENRQRHAAHELRDFLKRYFS